MSSTEKKFTQPESLAVVMLSGGKFFFACAMLAAIVLFVGRFVPLPLSLLAAEVFATILVYFSLDSYRLGTIGGRLCLHRRDVDEDYTPVQWIKKMTPIIAQLLLLITVLIYLEGALFSYSKKSMESLSCLLEILVSHC